MAQDMNPLLLLFHVLAEAVWRILAGIPAGLAAAYVSHVLLDGISARSIPLIA
jgi:hypothetical protein